MKQEIYNEILIITNCPKSYNKFCENRTLYLEDKAVSEKSRSVLNNLDIEKIGIFREIVIGTRRVKFEAIFTKTVKNTPLAWKKLVENFSANIFVPTVEDHMDVHQFMKFAKSEVATNLLENLASDYISFCFSNNTTPQIGTPIDSVWGINPKRRLLLLPYPEPSLYCDSGNEVDVFEISKEDFDFLLESTEKMHRSNSSRENETIESLKSIGAL